MADKTVCSITVLAPKASFETVRAAAGGEMTVDWMQAENAQQEACTLCFAAVDAADHLARIPGVEVKATDFTGEIPASPFILVLGPQSFERDNVKLQALFGEVACPSDEQSFIIRSAGGSACGYLVLGADRAGAMYGVYTLMRELGFRWLGPDDYDTFIPNALPAPLPKLDTRQTPSFKSRGAYGDHGEDYVLWFVRNRFNWANGGSGKEQTSLRRKLCIKCPAGGHGIYEKHLPPEKYFAEHPEWYGLYGGKRQNEIQTAVADLYNVCFSNREMRQTLIGEIVNHLIDGEYQHVDQFHVWSLDGGGPCECDECTKLGNLTDQLLLLACELRAAIIQARKDGRLNRDVLVDIPAYHMTLPIPTKPLPAEAPSTDVLVIFFPIERCYAHPFADPSCTEINAVLNKQWKQWTASAECSFEGEFFVGEYFNVSSLVSSAVPLTKIMAADIPYYHQTGARHFTYMHSVCGRLGTLSLTGTQYAAQLWNHELDCDAFIADYFVCRYHRHAQVMKRFYETLEHAMLNCKMIMHATGLDYRYALSRSLAASGSAEKPTKVFPCRHLTYGPEPREQDSGPSLTETIELLNQCERIIDDVALAVDDPDIVKRIADDIQRFRYTKNLVHFVYRLVRVRMFENRGNKSQAAVEARTLREIAEALRREDQMMKYCQGAGYNNNGLTCTHLYCNWFLHIMEDYGLDFEMSQEDRGCLLDEELVRNSWLNERDGD
jgi:hypothetical protein